MNDKLLTLLVCPICKGELDYIKKQDELICHHHQLAFPIRKGIPILLESDARKIESQS